ncbi:hypothetical protein EON83_21770 [bacterium]|nr:MAG: hypothetical protein EON83_21770 [bacterium]
MKRLFLTALPLLICCVAFAQPDPNVAGMGKNPPEAEGIQPINFSWDTPANAARSFMGALISSNELYLSIAVAGAHYGYYGDEEWVDILRNAYPFNTAQNLKVDDIIVDESTEEEATVTVSAHRESRNGQGRPVPAGERITYTLRLRHEANPLPFPPEIKKIWRVVPLSTEEVLAKSFHTLPPLSLAATLSLRDPRLLPIIRQQSAIGQLKQLGLGAMQFVQDYDEIYAFDDAAHDRALLPYVKSKSLFIIASTKDAKWHFNDNLSKTSLAAINEPARTVLFYDGSALDSEHLNFRFDDKTLICFADGHVSALTKDKLKDILWKP